MIYTVTINDKQYEVEVEKGKANLIRTTPVATQAAPAVAAPQTAPAASVAAPATPADAIASGSRIDAPMPGTILSVKVAVGDKVKEGTLLVILEAMKMENEIYAPCDGTVAQILTTKGATVNTGDALVVIS